MRVVCALLAVVAISAVLFGHHAPTTEARWYAATTVGPHTIKRDALKVEAVDQVDGAWAMLDDPTGDTESVPANPAAWKLTNMATSGYMVVVLRSLAMDPIDTIRSSDNWMGLGRTKFELTVRRDAGPSTCAKQDGHKIKGKILKDIKGESQTIGLPEEKFSLTLPPQGSVWVCIHLVERSLYNFSNEKDRVDFVWRYAGTGVAMALGYTYRVPTPKSLEEDGLEWEGAGSSISHVMAYIPWVGRAGQHETEPKSLCEIIGYPNYLFLRFSWPGGYVPSLFSGGAQWGEQILYRDPAKPGDPWVPLTGQSTNDPGRDRLFGGPDGSAEFSLLAGQPDRLDDTKIHRWNIAELGSVADPAEIPDWSGDKQMYQLDLRARLILKTDSSNGGNDKDAPPINWIDSPFAIRVYYPRHDNGESQDLRCKPVALPDDEMESSKLAPPFGGARIMTEDVIPQQ